MPFVYMYIKRISAINKTSLSFVSVLSILPLSTAIDYNNDHVVGSDPSHPQHKHHVATPWPTGFKPNFRTSNFVALRCIALHAAANHVYSLPDYQSENQKGASPYE
jgi:hypothetical protein